MIIMRGRTYRAKKPRQVAGMVNDRTVIFINIDGRILQYDGPAVDLGRNYPSVYTETFEKWAGEDVTDQLPKGEYQTWAEYLKAKVKK